MVTLDTFLHGLKKFAVREAKDFGTSFKPDFEPIILTATSSRQLIFTPNAMGTELSWMGITIRDMGTADYVYMAPTMYANGKRIAMVEGYYERGTDHAPVKATYYTVYTGTGEATVEIDGEWW
jgi:hypothetical protein